MRDGTRAFFQIRDIFHYFRAFKTEILQIHSLTGQILKQLSMGSRHHQKYKNGQMAQARAIWSSRP